MSNDSIPMPNFLIGIFGDWCDPYPLEGEFKEPSTHENKIWVNPGFSRKAEAIENAIRWHQAGKTVVCYLPIETSTRYAKRLIQYGVERLYFDTRPYRNCRGIELIILTGEKKAQEKKEIKESE